MRPRVSSPTVAMVVNALSGGGAERAATMLANLLAGEGLDVVIVAARTSGDDLVRSDVRMESLGKEPGSGLEGLPATVVAFRRLCRVLRPDIVHAHCELPELLAATAPRGVRLCVTEHTRMPWPDRPAVGKAVRRQLARRSATWVVPQASVEPWRVADRPFVVPNLLLGVTRRWQPAMATGAPLHVVSVSRLVESKRVDWIIRAVAAVGARLTVIGSGDDEHRLRRVADEVSGDVEFLGQVHDPWKTASAADIYVTAADEAECDPLSLAEALLHEMPILASRTPAHVGQQLRDRNLFCTETDLEQQLRSLVGGRTDLATLVDADAATRLRAARTPAAVLDAQLRAYGLA